MMSRALHALSLVALLAMPVLAQTPPPFKRSTVVTADGFTLAFVDADVRRVVDAVLGTMLKADYSVDPAVRGNITLRTAEPVPTSALIPLLERALTAIDAVVVPSGKGYRVLPRNAAREQIAAAGGGSDTSPGFAREVVTLRYVSARDVIRVLDTLIGADAVEAVDPDGNQLVLSGTSDERRAMRAMIAKLDIDAMSGMNFQIYKLENVDPVTVANELEQVFQPPLNLIPNRVRLVPLPRLKSLLAIAANRADLMQIDPWLRRLDVGVGGKPKIYSYAVQNGRARDLAASLQQVMGAGNVSFQAASTQETGAVSNDMGQSESKATTASNTDRAAVGASRMTTAQVSFEGGGDSHFRVVPNEETNILLIYATGEEYELLREVLEKIDRPVPQVLIEATFAEVTLNQDLSLGVDWSIFGNNSTLTQSNTRSSTPVSVFPGLSYSYIGATASVVLNTLQSKTNVKVLSSPKVIVVNNQPAMLQVGDQIPIVTQQSQGTGAPGAPVINSVELKDTGIILKVTPRVTESNTVTLDILQEVSDGIPTTTSGINSPTIQQRRISSTISTRSGTLVALGGLIRDRGVKQKQGVPLLSQIPFIGAAFGKQSVEGTRTELIVLITPTVIRAPQDSHHIAEQLIDGLELVGPMLKAHPQAPTALRPAAPVSK